MVRGDQVGILALALVSGNRSLSPVSGKKNLRGTMNSMQAAINQSTLTRLLANVFLFAVLMTALSIAAFELLNNLPINPVISTVVGTGIGIAAHAAGINQGAVLSPTVSMAVEPTNILATADQPTQKIAVVGMPKAEL